MTNAPPELSEPAMTSMRFVIIFNTNARFEWYFCDLPEERPFIWLEARDDKRMYVIEP